MSHRKTNKGDRVAHATIDSKTGLARTGVVEDVIRDDDGALVAARWDDEPEMVEAFDEREIVPLVGSLGGNGPVLLHPRHLIALIKHPIGGIALVLAFISALALGAFSQLHDWGTETIVGVGLGLILVTLLISGFASRIWRKTEWARPVSGRRPLHRGLRYSLHAHADAPGHSIDLPERLQWAHAELVTRGALQAPFAPPATLAELTRVHDPEYLDELAALSAEWDAPLDPELWVGTHTWPAATAASGALLAAARAAICEPAGERAWWVCLSRPGSHHAGHDEAMGFCVINHLAVAAADALARGAERIAIIDTDVHHGNGTEAIFADDERVLTASLHQWPFFPGTGRPGAGPGWHNVGLPAGAGHEAGLAAYAELLDHVRAHEPDLVLWEAGFDAHIEEPTADLRIENRTFFEWGRMSAALARELDCAAVFELGGGYAPATMGGFGAWLDGLADESDPPRVVAPPTHLLPAAVESIELPTSAGERAAAQRLHGAQALVRLRATGCDLAATWPYAAPVGRALADQRPEWFAEWQRAQPELAALPMRQAAAYAFLAWCEQERVRADLDAELIELIAQGPSHWAQELENTAEWYERGLAAAAD